MSFEKGKAIVGLPFEMIDKSGDPITTGVVTGFITKDGGVQQALSMLPEHEGNGQWTVNISAGEMQADIVGLVFIHDGGNFVPQHFTLKPEVVAVSVSPSTPVGVTTSEDLEWIFYGTIVRATSYFSKRLNTKKWDMSLQNDRESALIMATTAIDKLNYAGNKNDITQVLQFPRGDDPNIPIEIEFAAYEIALAFLDGYNQNEEVETLGVLSESYSGVRTTYDVGHVNEHIRAGIPSIEAWEYLKPFLRDSTQVRLSRVS